MRAVDDRVGHLEAPVGRQAVHVDRLLLRQPHLPLVADPVLVLLRDLERLLRVVKERLDPPRLRVDDVGAAEGLVHVVDDLELRPVLGRRLLRVLTSLFMSAYSGGWARTTSSPKRGMSVMSPCGTDIGLA